MPTSNGNEILILNYSVTVAGALITIIFALIAVIYYSLKGRVDHHEKRIEESDKKIEDKAREIYNHVGKHDSEINDIRVDMQHVETLLDSHTEKFSNILAYVQRIDSKIDKIIGK